MGFIDKFLDILQLSDDDDDYEDDDFFDDDYEEEYEESPLRKRLFKKGRKEAADEEEYENGVSRFSKASSRALGGKITPMRQPVRKGGLDMSVSVVKPVSVEETRTITENLLNGVTVILNLEGLDLEIAQRIIDFTSGAAFAINGNLQKISNYIFLVTPTNVDISGDLPNILGNSSLDASSMKGF